MIMMECWYFDVTALAEPGRFAYGLERLPWKERKEKVLRFRPEEARRLSLGAGLLAAFCLRRAGAADLSLGTGEHGKPYLLHEPEIHFNLSHSGKLAVCAVGNEPMGVDVEEPQVMKEGVARLSFTMQEKDWLASQPDQDHAFVRLWTRKESLLKLFGKGFYQSPLSADICPDIPRQDGISFFETEAQDHQLCVCTKASAVKFSRCSAEELLQFTV